jgi:hypothetical protein
MYCLWTCTGCLVRVPPPFDTSGKEVGLRFLGWLQEEMEVLPTIVTGLMSFSALVTCEEP